MANEEKQWPDSAYEKAKAWADTIEKNGNYDTAMMPARDLYDEVRAEERRRESQVCGARHPLSSDDEPITCSAGPDHETNPQKWSAHTADVEGVRYSWYNHPPQCDKAHTGDVPAARYLVISPGSLGGVNLESADSWTEALDICGMDFGFDSYIIDRNEKKAYFEGREAECDRPHLSEEAQRAIGKVLKYGHAWNCYKETHAGIPSVDGEPHICTCGRDALRENYDREAQS